VREILTSAKDLNRAANGLNGKNAEHLSPAPPPPGHLPQEIAVADIGIPRYRSCRNNGISASKFAELCRKINRSLLLYSVSSTLSLSFFIIIIIFLFCVYFFNLRPETFRTTRIISLPDTDRQIYYQF